MENKRTRQKILRKTLYLTALLIFTGLMVLLWSLPLSLTYQIILSIGLALLLLLIVCMDRLQLNYTDTLLEELSQLLDTLINSNNTAIFPENEDNLLSKLQTQVVKLSSMLKLQHEEMEKEKMR